MADKVRFGTSGMHKTFYEVQDEQWLGNKTYVIIFQDMFDTDGDKFHLEVEYHTDEEKITYTKVYDHENVGFPTVLLSPCIKKQIDEYILRQVGVIRADGFLNTQTIGVELTLDVPKDMKMGEYREWLENLSIEINRIVPTAKEKLMGRVKILGITNKGIMNNGK